jgi:hypothetical protein
MAMAGAIDTQAYLDAMWGETGFAYTSTRDSGDVETELATVCRYTVGEVEAEISNGVYLRNDEKVTFALDALPYDPKPRDWVTPEGEEPRVVLSVVKNPFLKFWDLRCRNLILAYDLRDSATVRRSVPSPTASGLRTRNPTDVYTAVPCRLQPVEMAVDFDADRVNQRDTYKCFLGQAIKLQAGDTIVVSGVQYEVTAESRVDSFDTLCTADVERVS